MPIEFKIFFLVLIFSIGSILNYAVVVYYGDIFNLFQNYLFEIPERYQPLFVGFVLFLVNAVFLRFVFSKTCKEQIEDECFKKEMELQKKIDDMELELKLLRAYRDKVESKR